MLLQPGVYIIVIIENTVSAILHKNNYRKTSLERYLVFCAGPGRTFFGWLLRSCAYGHFNHSQFSVKSAF